MPIYRPRALLSLTVPVPDGAGKYDPVTYSVEVRKASLERNDQNHADALSVEVDWKDTGIDPRWIASATCEFFIGDADDNGNWEPTKEDLRFIGRMVKASRSISGDSFRVSLDFHDYTSFFLVAKPVATDATPLFSDTLDVAWSRLCESVPDADVLSDNIRLLGLASFPLIGSAVAPRFRALGQVPVKPGIDAWAIWQQVVGMMGLISYFEYDECVVTTATDYYTASNTPKFLWGRNILDMQESKNNDRALRGVGITSYDPLSGKTLEATWDPLAGKRKIKKAAKPPAKHRKSKKKAAPKVEKPDLDFFQYPGVTDPARLLQIAQNVYAQRSLGELDGSLTTADMSAESTSEPEFDLLSLVSGDTIDVRFLESDDANYVRALASRSDRVNYLVTERGYVPAVAQIVAGNVERMTDKANLMYVKAAKINLETNEDGGTFRVAIDYINKLDPDGGSAGDA